MSNRLFQVKCLLDVGCKMSDGVRLSNDIYLPTVDGPFPVVFIRTPYSNNDPVKKVKLARKYAENGYAVVVQDVRGRYDSDGTWEPFFNEAKDGKESHAWIAEQDFCNGSIVQMGRSYEGYCAWMSAFDHHPALKGIIPIVALPDPVVNVPLMNGSVMWNMITWAMFVHGKTNQDLENYNWEELYTFKPLNQLDKKLGFESKPWQDWMAHPLKDDYWKPACYMHRLEELDIPALHISGWYDDDGISTFHNYPTCRKLAKSKDDQYLIIGPWPHATNTKTIVHGVDFGPEEVVDLDGAIIDWLDMIVGGRPENWGDRKRAQIFLMGENTWYEYAEWPKASTKELRLFLHSESCANSMLGDGQLLIAQPTEDGKKSNEYTYDPENPTPYLYDAGTLQVGGPFDARPVQRRDDVLCFTTPAFKNSLTFCGRVFADLFVSTTAEDTEFIGKLSVVRQNGEARQLCDGNIRLAQRESLERLDPVTPGTVVKIHVDMWATGITLSKGEKIRLEISSAVCPKFSPHPNTLESPGTAVNTVIAQNTVYHNPEFPSCIILPIESVVSHPKTPK